MTLPHVVLLSRPVRRSLRWRTSKAALRGGQLARVRAAPLGPRGVVASLTRGLRRVGASHSLDPRREPRGDLVGVITDFAALREGIGWRRSALVPRLVAGPNLAVLPGDEGGLVTAPEVDLCLLPSEWVKRLFENEAPSLVGRTAVWAAGVDPEYWAPPPDPPAEGRPLALLYLKRLRGQPFPSAAEIERVRVAITKAGFRVETLVYGSFDSPRYRVALWRATMVVFVTPTETQSFAQAEAWAADVPTLVWRLGRMRAGRRTFATSSAPYLNAANGRWFADAEELTAMLDDWHSIRDSVAPREWVLEHMTDEICARRYLELAVSTGVDERG